mgnify:CR=1 FL=1
MTPKSFEKGMSILEILIVVGIVSLVCVPSIQVIYSLHSNYILDIVSGDTGHQISQRSGQNILDVSYHGDGNIRSLFKKGGMWDVQSVGNKQSQQKCTDFTISNQSSHIPPVVHLYTSDELDLGTSTKLTDIAFVGDGVFISADSASTSLPDIYTYGVHNFLYTTSKPTLTVLSAENTGPGISRIQSVGAYLLMANTGVKSQVSVSRIAGGVSPRIDFTIPGSNSSTTPITKTILYTDGKIIVGTEKSVLPEIFIFDIYTGQTLGSIETGYGVNDMLVVNDLLVVAGPRDPEIQVFDTRTFAKVGEYDLAGGSGNAKVLNIFGDQLYVGRTKGGNEFEVLNFERINSNPISSFAPKFSPAFNQKIQWSIDALLKHEEYSMLFTADEYGEFQLYKDALDNRNNGIDAIDSGSNVGAVLQYKVDLPDRVSSAVCFKNSIWMTFKSANTDTESASPYRLGVLVFN